MFRFEHTIWRCATERWRCAGFGALALIVSGSLPALAQTSSPDIVAKERSDPASGEVVIINRKKSKASAPNPYAPAPKVPLSSSTGRTGADAEEPARAAIPRPRVPQSNDVTRSQRVDLPPPLPQPNTDRSTPIERLRQFPQAGLAPNDGGERANRYQAQRGSLMPRSTRRTVGRHTTYRGRPWGQCRILARRCSSGFQGSCYIWQRRCT